MRAVHFCVLLSFLVTLKVQTLAAFLQNVRSTHITHGPTHLPRLFSSRKSFQDRNDDTSFLVHVIVTDNVILPGEQMSLSLSDEEAIPLLQDCLEQERHTRVVLAVRLVVDDDTITEQQELNLAQIASLCDTVGLHVGTQENQVILELNCVGRVRLLEMKHQYDIMGDDDDDDGSHYQFTAEWLQEGIDNQSELDKAKRLEQNIDLLMQRISKLEQQIKEGNNTATLMENYEITKARVAQTIAKSMPQNENTTSYMESSDLLQLTATSWAVFLCLNDTTLEARYRLRALDWHILVERMKLAQYVLREKQLLLQGLLLQKAQETTSCNDNKLPGVDQDAFQ
ncbi:expressed unknown protein [Seminavis robusta]|uniref:Lon N-terminal domain-containing protein n=1 Tax=Seminavis robusta TaxID=568900 RepID=A0A9N8EQK1_9STRA|nr:expressed unknown protein [Seminavis robusta]|eukprot:Sro1558_g282380.1 n/a (340) ;mRNA; f:13717-14736